jgi:hypothetical protein
MDHFGLHPAAFFAVAVIVFELAASAMVVSGFLRWAGSPGACRLHAAWQPYRPSFLGDCPWHGPHDGNQRLLRTSRPRWRFRHCRGNRPHQGSRQMSTTKVIRRQLRAPRPACLRGSLDATVLGNTGSFMRDVASSWLMTDLSASPAAVAMVQAAGTLPIFLLAIPAGVLTDILDRRKFLIAVQILLASVSMSAHDPGPYRHAIGQRADRPDLPRRHWRRIDGADMAGDRAGAGEERGRQERRRAQLARHQYCPVDRACGRRPAPCRLRCRRHLRRRCRQLSCGHRGTGLVATGEKCE